MRRTVLLLTCFALVAACQAEPAATTAATTTPTVPATPQTAEQAGLHWWNDRVFYEIFVRSFKDSDGDGVGDLAGLTASLDYLNDGDPATTGDLGITGIWLMPIFPSPSYHGYDVTDYRAINPDYGTMEDFRAFLEAAHARGIAVIVDLVINHTSRDHPWFRSSRQGDPDYADWYLWSDTDPATTGPWGQDVWHQWGDRFYFGLFWEGMPDLNLENPAVTAEIRDVARFWLEDVGVDGFRLDAAKHLIEAGTVMADTPETVAWLEAFNAYVHQVAPEAMVVGEVWSETEQVAAYIPASLDLAFEFSLSEAGGAAVQAGDASVLAAALAEAEASYPEDRYAVFLTNHDQNRIMSVIGGDVDLAKLAATWLLTAPGVPFLYYGEEVGLGGTKPDEQIRTPMPWTARSPGVGFTDGTPWEAAYPGFETFNVAGQTGDPTSLLSLYRTLIRARQSSPALRYGEVVEVETGGRGVGAFLRTVGEDHVLVVLNLTAEVVTDYALALEAGPLAGMQGVETLAGPPAAAPQVGAAGGFAGYRPLESLPRYGALVLRFTTEPSAPPPSTTTTILAAATAADVAVVEEFHAAMSSDDPSAWLALIAPDAAIDTGAQVLGLFDPLPGMTDQVADWDGDGALTIADAMTSEGAWGQASRARVESACAPAGAVVACSFQMTDVFHEAAATGGWAVARDYTVANGRIVLIGENRFLADESELASIGEAWIAQVAAYERWVSDTHPERYSEVFSGACCAGTTQNLILTPESIPVHTELIAEWAS